MHLLPRRQKIAFLSLSLLIIAVLVTSCAPRPYLIVDYPVPEATNQLKGQKVRLQVIDRRSDQEVLTPAAARQFEGFEGRYSLAWVGEGQRRIMAGEQDLETLFLLAVQKRMQQMGAQVATHEAPEAPLMQVLIDTFKIDLQNQKWIATIRYEANLTVNGQVVAREMVSGEAERVRIIGRKGADNNLSDIFATIINRLEIPKLFRQIKL